MDARKLLDRIRRGAVKNIRFHDLVQLLQELGFRLQRSRGSHRVYVHPQIPRVLSLQPDRGEAKPYQVIQVLRLLEAYNLLEELDR